MRDEAQAQARARRALVGAGLDPSTALERAPSQANEAWLGDGLVLRVNYRGDIGRLRREAELASRLPAEARYPGLLDYGHDGELEWLVSRRVDGVVLARAWPELDRARRERAISEFARALRALHGVDFEGMWTDGELDPPHVLPLDRLQALTRELGDAGLIEPELVGELQAFVREHQAAFDDRGLGLVHGDPHLENVLWDGEHVSALLDLEWSRRSWLECDLETLLSFADHPWLFVAEDYEERARAEDYVELPVWLRREHPELFAHPRLDERLAILHISRTLTIIAECESPGSVSPLRIEHLRAVLGGSSFLTRALSSTSAARS